MFMRLLTRDMSCLLTDRLQGNSGYGIDVWVILHLGTFRFLFPSLFTSNTEPIKCETCIREKNQSYFFSQQQ